MAGQVFAIASGKGGVGKTTTVVNLGVILRRSDHSVALVDADLGMANLGPMLGVTGELTLHDVLSGRATLDDALVEEAPGFAVLPGSGSLTDYADADPRNLGDVLDTLAESYDFVLVDTGAGMSHEDVLPLGLADGVLLVASPDPAAIGDTRKTAELADLAQGDIAGLVVTKADSDTDAKHVASQIGVDLLGVIPYDPTVRDSTASGRPLEATDPDTPAARAYRELASRLVEGAANLPAELPSADEAPDGVAGAAASEPPADADAGATGDDAESPAEGSAPESEAAERPAPEADPEEPEPTPATPEREPSDAPDEADDETAGETSETAESANGGDTETAEDEATEDEADEEDYLAEFEDDEPESKGGILSRIGRLFR